MAESRPGGVKARVPFCPEREALLLKVSQSLDLLAELVEKAKERANDSESYISERENEQMQAALSVAQSAWADYLKHSATHGC